MIIGTTNFLAVAVVALVPVVIGFLWYSRIGFRHLWMRLEGVTPERDAKMKKIPIQNKLIIAYLTYLLISYTLAILMNYLVVASVVPALILGLVMWLGFMAPAAIFDYLWSPKAKPWGLYYLHISYFLISVLLMSVILALWI